MPTTNKPGAIVSVTVGGKTFDCAPVVDKDKNLGRWDRPDYSKVAGTIDTSTLTDDDVEFLKSKMNSKDDQDDT